METDYQNVMDRFTQAGLDLSYQVSVDDFPHSPTTVAHAVIRHYTGKGYDLPRGGLSQTEGDCRVELKKEGQPGVSLLATRVGQRTRAVLTDLASLLAA